MRVMEKVEHPKPVPPKCSASGCGLACLCPSDAQSKALAEVRPTSPLMS